MNLSEIRERLAGIHHEHPQRAKAAEMGLAEVESGLKALAALGHNYSLTDAPADAPVEYPKDIGKGRIVNSAGEELAALEAEKKEEEARLAPPATADEKSEEIIAPAGTASTEIVIPAEGELKPEGEPAPPPPAA